MGQTMASPGLFDYARKIQTEALPLRHYPRHYPADAQGMRESPGGEAGARRTGNTSRGSLDAPILFQSVRRAIIRKRETRNQKDWDARLLHTNATLLIWRLPHSAYRVEDPFVSGLPICFPRKRIRAPPHRRGAGGGHRCRVAYSACPAPLIPAADSWRKPPSRLAPRASPRRGRPLFRIEEASLKPSGL
jgi:hypothetical protein